MHGGEGSSGATSGNGGELDDVIGGVSRDPFAEEDGGAPLAKGRAVMVAGRVGTGCVVRSEHEHASGGGDGDGGEALRVQQRRQRRRGEGQGQKPAEKVCAAVVAVLEDLWKLNTCTMRWERVSRAHTSGAGGGGQILRWRSREGVRRWCPKKNKTHVEIYMPVESALLQR